MNQTEVPWIRVDQLNQHVGKTVELRGWLYNRRSSGKLHFLQIRDGSGIVQAVVFKGDVDESLFEQMGRIPQESSVTLVGEVREDKRSPIGVELGVASGSVVQEAETYPITKKEHSTGFLMERRHLWIRSKKQHATLRIRGRIIKAIRDYLDDAGYLNVDSPIFTPNACEGTTNLFEVEYFDDKAYLTQSGQLYAERQRWRLARSTVLGQRFVPKSPRLDATSPSFGWSSRKLRSQVLMTRWW